MGSSRQRFLILSEYLATTVRSIIGVMMIPTLAASLGAPTPSQDHRPNLKPNQSTTVTISG
jgi:hypothetical protein